MTIITPAIKPVKIEAGVYAVGPFLIEYEPDMEIAELEGDRKYWQIMVLPGNPKVTEGAYGRFATLREAVTEIVTRHGWQL